MIFDCVLLFHGNSVRHFPVRSLVPTLILPKKKKKAKVHFPRKFVFVPAWGGERDIIDLSWVLGFYYTMPPGFAHNKIRLSLCPLKSWAKPLPLL
jgi:hypothetical protein